MKYIIFKGHGCYHPILFSDHTTHAQIKLDGCNPISAGFVKFNRFGSSECYGKSDSLKLNSRGELDSDLIDKWRMNFGSSSFLSYD